jgi:hypothetical protein
MAKVRDELKQSFGPYYQGPYYQGPTGSKKEYYYDRRHSPEVHTQLTEYDFFRFNVETIIWRESLARKYSPKGGSLKTNIMDLM